jgi:uncharacterized protein YdaU (DUF1376 family)
MAKDPAFLFYTNDFLSGIQDLTMEERGQYITLLCLQHQKGHLSEKAIRLCLGNAAADVMAKFRQDSAGLWYNDRLEQEIEKRAASSKKQKARAEEGWKKRKINAESNAVGDAYGNAAALPLENEDENEDENVIVVGLKKESHVSVLKKYANSKSKIIYDLQVFFAATGQLEALQRAGWIDFDGFMRANPAAAFNDDNHVYNSFRKYHETKTNGTKKKLNLSDVT